MFKFANKNDYLSLTTCIQVSPDTIEWTFKDGDVTHAGSFELGTPQFDLCQTLCPVYQPLDQNAYLVGMKLHYSCELDKIAGTVRNSYVSPGTLIEEEYHISQTEALEWDGVSSPVPLSIQIRSDAVGITPLAARDEIRTISAQWKHVLLTVREHRLKGKAEINTAATLADVEIAFNARSTALIGMVNNNETQT